MDRVRMSTFVNASGQNLAKASHFDTAFVMEDLLLHKLEDGLSGMFLEFILQYQVILIFFFHCVGLRVAQVRLLFDLPPNLGLFLTLSHI